jgi:hypothetical protein
VPDEAASVDVAPVEVAPDDVAPDDVVPVNVVPDDVAPVNVVPVNVVPAGWPFAPAPGSARISTGSHSCRYAGAMLLHAYLDRVGPPASSRR